MALFETILIIGILIILVIVIYNVFISKKSMLMSGIQPAIPGININSNKLAKNNSSNYSYAIWFVVDDWNINYGSVKNIIHFSENSTSSNTQSENTNTNTNIPFLNPNQNNCCAAFDRFENDLLIGIKTFAQTTNQDSMSPPSLLPSSNYYSQQLVTNKPNFRYETFKISNINIQKWVCLICSVEGRTLDIYLQGKLVRSFILPGVAAGLINNNVYIGGENSFNGYVSRFQYFTNSLNPQDAYNIYREGLDSDLIGDLLNKYHMKIQFYEYNNALGKPLMIP